MGDVNNTVEVVNDLLRRSKDCNARIKSLNSENDKIQGRKQAVEKLIMDGLTQYEEARGVKLIDENGNFDKNAILERFNEECRILGEATTKMEQVLALIDQKRYQEVNALLEVNPKQTGLRSNKFVSSHIAKSEKRQAEENVADTIAQVQVAQTANTVQRGTQSTVPPVSRVVSGVPTAVQRSTPTTSQSVVTEPPITQNVAQPTNDTGKKKFSFSFDDDDSGDETQAQSDVPNYGALTNGTRFAQK